MIHLRESDLHRNPALLADRWQAPDTFVLLPEKCSFSQTWLDESLALVPEELRRAHFIMLTSGSTGQPKLIIGQRERSEALAQMLHARQDSEPVVQTLSLLPLSYTYSFVNQWLWSHVMGRAYILTSGLSDPKTLKAQLQAAKNAMICLVGVQVPLLLKHLSGCCFPGIIRVHFAGGRFPQERLTELFALFPNGEIFNNYGCAEAMPRLTVRRATEATESANIGWPLPGIELCTDDASAIRFRSPYSAVGIIENLIFRDIQPQDWTSSGDLGQINSDGSWRLLGRVGEVFKRHGEKVSLSSLMTTITAVWTGQCAFYRETDSTGEDGCILVLAPKVSSEDIKPVLMALRKHHPRAHWPLRIETLPTLPLLSNGKTDTHTLATVPNQDVLWRQHI